MSIVSIARRALAQRSALRKARRLAHARAQARQGLARSPFMWACGLLAGRPFKHNRLVHGCLGAQCPQPLAPT